jgi:hypothetical protein
MKALLLDRAFCCGIQISYIEIKDYYEKTVLCWEESWFKAKNYNKFKKLFELLV